METRRSTPAIDTGWQRGGEEGGRQRDSSALDRRLGLVLGLGLRPPRAGPGSSASSAQATEIPGRLRAGAAGLWPGRELPEAGHTSVLEPGAQHQLFSVPEPPPSLHACFLVQLWSHSFLSSSSLQPLPALSPVPLQLGAVPEWASRPGGDFARGMGRSLPYDRGHVGLAGAAWSWVAAPLQHELVLCPPASSLLLPQSGWVPQSGWAWLPALGTGGHLPGGISHSCPLASQQLPPKCAP